MRIAGARAAFILERQIDRLHPVASAAAGEKGPPQMAGSLRLTAVQEAMTHKQPIAGDGFAVFPYSSPGRSEGVVYLDGPPASPGPTWMLGCQAFLNLIPLAFLTLPEGADGETVEVEAEEIGDRTAG